MKQEPQSRAKPIPKVSVLTITYNHERFIEAAIGGALAQQTDFDFEIVVGEDCSTDRTREILLSLQQKFPQKIRLLLNPQNIGLMRNFVQTFDACRGQYIALLEGDDYWTDPTKLQQQADFLDAHSDCVICHHNVLRVVEGQPNATTTWHPSSLTSRWQTIDDMLSLNIVVTCSSMFRAGLFPKLPDWFVQGRAPDWLLHVLIAKHGRVHYSDAVMGAYRIHPDSVWSGSPRIQQLQGIIHHAELVKGELTASQQAKLQRSITRWHEELIELLIRDDRCDEAREHAQRNLTNLQSYERLQAFFEGLKLEQAGRRLDANRSYFKALHTGRGTTRVKTFDVLLAVFRNNFPRGYVLFRDLYRSLTGHQPE